MLLGGRCADQRRDGAWLGRSRLSSGSSRISSRGRRTSAWAISRRCCSPPETAGRSGARVGRRPDELDRLARPRSPRAARRSGSAPAMRPSRPRRTRSMPRIALRGIEAAALGQVADLAGGLPGAPPSTDAAARGRAAVPRSDLHQRGLADPVGPEQRDELPLRDRRSPRRSRPRARRRRAAPSHDRDHRGSKPASPHVEAGARGRRWGARYRPSRRCSAAAGSCSWATCHSWKVAEAGREGLGDGGHRYAGSPWRAAAPPARRGSRSGSCRHTP